MWLRDALPIDFPGARILVYGYDTRLIRSMSFQNLTDLGKTLQIDMKGIRVCRIVFFIFKLPPFANLGFRSLHNLVL